MLRYSSHPASRIFAAYSAAEDDAHRLACAIALVLVGDNSHLGDVIAAAEAADWSKGFDFRGLGNYGRQTAPVDYLIYTLQRSGATKRVLPVLKTLTAKIAAVFPFASRTTAGLSASSRLLPVPAWAIPFSSRKSTVESIPA